MNLLKTRVSCSMRGSLARWCGILVAAVLGVPALAPTARADLWPVLEAHWKLDETDTGSTLVHDARGGVPGTRMGFPGLKNPEDVKAVVDYLQTLK